MINDIKKELISLAEPKYKEFSSSLLPNINNILGVRLPILRKIAKRISKENYLDFLKQNDDEFFELTMLEGMIIGYLPTKEQEKYIKKFIPRINSTIGSVICGFDMIAVYVVFVGIPKSNTTIGIV